MCLKVILQILFFIIITSCGNSESSRPSEDDNASYDNDSATTKNEEEEEYDPIIYEGEYCAKVTYYNSNTGTQSEYTLTIEVNENILERINFPNGWLDDDHYRNEEFDEDGNLSFTSDVGYDYTVQIIGRLSGCLDNVPLAYQCVGITVENAQCKHLTDNLNGYCWQHENQE